MSFATLALISLLGLLGPLLAVPRNWHLPIVLGELVAGIAFGASGLRILHSGDQTFAFLADIGFALVMFVVGTHVPVRDVRIRAALGRGALLAGLVGALAVAGGWGIASAFHTGHAALYAVLIASSSAALVLPTVDSLRLGGPSVLQLLAQVAIADTACIVLLPLAIDPAHAGRAALGACAIAAAAAVLFLVLREGERAGLLRRVRRFSKRRQLALELRVDLLILFTLAALARWTHVSIMLAGFSFGLVIAAIGPPRRLARQLFGVSEGFFGPLFFIWLGASINVRELGQHRSFILLGLALGAAAVLAHLTTRLTGSPVPLALMACAQIGIPVAAATLGTQLHLLRPGEAPALVLGALVTIAAAVLGGSIAARSTRRGAPADAGSA